MCIAALGGVAGTIGTLASVAGTAVGAVGTIASAQAQAAAATYRAKQERMLAEDSLKRGAQQEEAQRRKTAALYGRQRAVMAASGLDLGSGSPLRILGDTAQLGELDAATIQDNARREANYHQANADLSSMEASSASTAGALGAFGTVLGGVSSLADKWYRPTNQQSSGGSTSSYSPFTSGRAAWAGN